MTLQVSEILVMAISFVTISPSFVFLLTILPVSVSFAIELLFEVVLFHYFGTPPKYKVDYKEIY